MNRRKSIFRSRSQQTSKPNARSPLKEVSEFQLLKITSTPESKRRATDYIIPANNYDENKDEKFELMNVKIVIYGLTGLVCEYGHKKKQKFGKKETISPTSIGMARKDMKRLMPYNATSIDFQTESNTKKTLDTTTAVVSCHRNGTSNNISFETFLPSLPLGNPIATSLDKVCYAAIWPSEQSILQQDESAKDRSSFMVTRCMKQAAFILGAGARSNYYHETIEFGINISRGTELIRLGTALIVINGEEEGEVEINVPTKPFVFHGKKVKKKNKYGYFSDDSSRRFYLENNSILKVGIQVIPEEAMRFAREKVKKRKENENELNELLEQDKLKNLLRERDNHNHDCKRREVKNFPIDQAMTVNGVIPKCRSRTNSLFPDFLCGSIPASWVPRFLKRPETEPDVPTEIIADDDIDQLVIQSLISSISEVTDTSESFTGFIAGGEL